MLLLLRLVHIIAGVFWVGSVLFVTFTLMPAIRAAGPPGAAIMQQLGRRMPVLMMTASLLTIAAGIWLMMIVSGRAPGVWMRTGMGRTFAFGGGLAILTFIGGAAVNMPLARRMTAIGSAAAKRGGPPTPDEAAELQRLQARLAASSVVIAIALLIATAAMAVARYVV